jgi:predicted secreted protein
MESFMNFRTTFRKKIYYYLQALFLLLPQLALAGTQLQLDAQISSKVANDEMVVTAGTVKIGQNVASLNEAVLSALNDALKIAATVPGVKSKLEGAPRVRIVVASL